MEIPKSNGDLKVVNRPPIEDFPEKVSELAKGEEQAVAEVRGQRGQIRDRYHFFALPANSKLSNNGRIWKKEMKGEILGISVFFY